MGGSEVEGTVGGALDDAASGTGFEGVEVDGAGGTSLGSGSSGKCSLDNGGDYYQKVLFFRPNHNGFKHL